MTFTWTDYQNALNIVKTFEQEREEIRRNRRSSNPYRTYDDIIWLKRMELCEEEYGIKKLSKEKQEEYRDFFNEHLRKSKDDLLAIRFRSRPTIGVKPNKN